MTKQSESINVFDLIDSLCKEYRAEWKQKKRPRLEDWIARVPENAQAQLFRNLLDIEVKQRYRQKESPTSQEYVKRFPKFASQVRQVFDESTMGTVDQYVEEPLSESVDDGATQQYDMPFASRLGDYELICELGRGAFGVVYEARHVKDENRVALKTLPTGFDGQQINVDRLRKFRNEFRSLSEINHPNLVGMQTLEVDESQWFFTMDLIEGQDFLSYVRPGGELDLNRLRSCINQLAAGIIELHALGIIHRDLKPSNVMVRHDGQPIILDFGLVAQLQTQTDATVSRSGMFAGTPRYAAPEQMLGERSEASDWYAFGTMLFEALTGGPPFSGGYVELLRKKQSEDPRQISADHQLPEDLVRLANALIQRDPLQRPVTSQIVETLQLHLDTRVPGSTLGSRSSAGSVDDQDADPVNTHDHEIILIGRERQLAQLEAAKKNFLERREPQVVWVSGKSGEGKSSLVEKFLDPLRFGSDVLVLSGRCYDRESVPFKAIDSIIDPLATFLRNRSPAGMGDFISSNTRLLINIFPILRQVKWLAKAPKPDVRGMDSRQLQLRAFDALRDLWIGIGRQTPIVLFIDDLQWGDADSVEMLAEMLAGSPSAAVMLIGSFRSDEVEQSPFLNKWKTMQRADQLSLPCDDVIVERLDSNQGLELLETWSGTSRSELEPEVIQLVDESGGNPFLLELLFDSYQIQEGQPSERGLADLFDRRLSRLPGGAKPLLCAVAVAGQATCVDELAAAAELDEQPFSLLTRMRSEKLVRLVGSKDDLKIDTYHDKVRETMLEEMDAADRRACHLRFAEFIEKKDPSTEAARDTERVTHPRLFDLAYHFSQADDPRAFPYQLSAGQQALSTFAVDEALEFFREAQERLPESANRSTQYQVALGLAQATLLTGQIDDRRQSFEKAKELAHSPLETAHCLRGIAQAWLRKGKPKFALDYFREAVRLLGDPEPRTIIGRLWQITTSQLVFLMIPRWMSFRQRNEDSERERFLADITNEFMIAMQTDFWAMSACQMKQGVRAKFSSSFERRIGGYTSYMHFFSLNGFGLLATRYRSLIERMHHDSTSDVLTIEANAVLAETAYYLGELDRAEEQLRRSARQQKEIRGYHEGMAYHHLRHLESIRGRAARICFWSERELEFAMKNGDPVAAAWANYGLADGMTRSGCVQAAIQLARDAGAQLRKSESQTFMIADQELGRALLQASRYQDARETLDSTKAYFSRRFLFAELWLDTLPLLTEAILADNWHRPGNDLDRKDLRQAQRMAFKTRFQCNKFPTLKPHSLRASGRAAAAAGKPNKAIRYFDKAIAAAEKIGAHYEHARALIDKSLMDYPESNADRQRGIRLLESLGSVLPDAEVEYLGLDRDEHHARAAAAREKDRPEESAGQPDEEGVQESPEQLVR